MIQFSIISFFHFILIIDILRYLNMINQLIPTAVENVDAGVVVSGEFFYVELFLNKNSGGYQTHIVGGILDNIIYQLFSELLIFVNFEWVAIEVPKELFKLIKVHHIAMRVVHLIKELEKLM